MKNYVVFNGEGEILRIGICPDDMLKIQARNGELVLEGIANDVEHQVSNGKVERKSQEAIDDYKKKMKLDPREILIRERMDRILRNMAIKELEEKEKIS